MTQLARIVRYLEIHGSISTREAMHSLECYRCSERIRELERLGYVFDHQPEITDNGARIMRYVLLSAPQMPLPARMGDSKVESMAPETGVYSAVAEFNEQVAA